MLTCVLNVLNNKNIHMTHRAQLTLNIVFNSGRAVRARVCCRSLAGISGSNFAGAWMCVSCECCVL